jgi:DNA-directed RNA polymerase subunit RPC12/RpoP
MAKRTKYPGASKKKLSSTYNLKILAPKLVKMWHPVKNGKLTPVKVTPGSHRKVWWKCGEGHEWQATIANRAENGCPYCSGRRASKEYNLSVTNPELVKQWHPVKNGDLTPGKVTPGSSRKVWWLCDKGHEWQTNIAGRAIKKNGCPYCSGKRPSKE